MAELVIQNPSITSGDFSFSGDAITAIAGHPVAGVGGGGTQSDYVYVPSFNDQTGDITFTLDTTASEGKGPWHISGAQGPQGPSGTNGKDAPIPEFQINSSNAHWEWKYTNESNWTDLNVVASGEVGPQGIQGPSGAKGDTGAKGADATPLTADTATIAGGTQVTISYTSGGDPLAQFNVLSGAQGASGQKGADGKNGYSPTVSTTTTASEDRTGTVLTFTYGDEGGQTVSYTAWNGKDGTGATVDLLEGTGIHITHAGNSYTIGVSADYALKSELPDVTDMATKTWVGQQGYLTSVPDSYATKTYANDASANALSQAQSWVETEGYLKAVPAEYATKTYANEASAYALSQAETYADSTSAEALSQAKSWTNQQNFATSAGLAANTHYEMTNAGWTSAIKIQVDSQAPSVDDGILHIILES